MLFVDYEKVRKTRSQLDHFSKLDSNTVVVLQIGRSLVRSQIVSLEFFIDIKSFRSHYGPGVDSASNRNKYHEYFMGLKAVSA